MKEKIKKRDTEIEEEEKREKKETRKRKGQRKKKTPKEKTAPVITDEAKELLAEHFCIFEFLETNFDTMCPVEFYKFIFPNMQNAGEMNPDNDFSEPNPIYIFRDRDNDSIVRRIMLKNTWEDDFLKYIEHNEWAICGGLSYLGRKNVTKKATKMNALIIDLDSVGYNEFMNFMARLELKPEQLRSIPVPTFLATSGTGLHIYYVFEEPIELFPHTKTQLRNLKDSLTYRIWDYKGTTRLNSIQYQPIGQGFRMIGSINGKYGENYPITAFKIGNKVSLEYLNQYVPEDKKVDLEVKYKPSTMTLDEAKKKYPSWYRSRFYESGEPKPVEYKDYSDSRGIWNVKRDVYDWWLSKKDEITGGHRYYYLLCMSVYASKCNISKSELKKDMYKIYEDLANIPHTNELTKKDVDDALKCYDKSHHDFTIDHISKITGVEIKKNKRNFRTQEQHIKIMNAIRGALYPNDEWRNLDGRPKGSGTKEQLVLDYVKENPNDNPTTIARNLGISRTTVYKYLKKIEH